MAANQAEAVPITARLHRLFDGLQAFLAADPSPDQRALIRERARETLETIVDTEPESESVEKGFSAKSRAGWTIGWRF